MYTHRMPVVYETETPLAPRSGLGPYREADYWKLRKEIKALNTQIAGMA